MSCSGRILIMGFSSNGIDLLIYQREGARLLWDRFQNVQPIAPMYGVPAKYTIEMEIVQSIAKTTSFLFFTGYVQHSSLFYKGPLHQPTVQGYSKGIDSGGQVFAQTRRGPFFVFRHFFSLFIK